MSSQQTSGVLSGLLVAVNIVGPLGQTLRLLLVQAGPKAFSPGGAVSGCAGAPASKRPLVPAAGLPPTAAAPSYEVFSLLFPCPAQGPGHPCAGSFPCRSLGYFAFSLLAGAYRLYQRFTGEITIPVPSTAVFPWKSGA